MEQGFNLFNFSQDLVGVGMKDSVNMCVTGTVSLVNTYPWALTSFGGSRRCSINHGAELLALLCHLRLLTP